jgi:hypothetical protein
VGAFGKGVNNNHDGIITIGLRKLDNEVHTDMVPTAVRNSKGLKFSKGSLPDGLGPKTHVTGAGVESNELRHARPPIVPRHKLQGLPTSRVSSKSGVMAESHNATTKITTWWNIELSTEVDKTISFIPL